MDLANVAEAAIGRAAAGLKTGTGVNVIFGSLTWGRRTTMTTPADGRRPGHNGFRHEALVYGGASEFLAMTVPFVRAAVDRHEPILVVLPTAKLGPLTTALGDHAGEVLFADMSVVGHNPALIIPAWQDFLHRHAVTGQPVRGVGEPVWAQRSGPELAECQRHEELLNVAFDDVDDFWLLCPYDTSSLDPGVISAARRSHGYVSGSDGSAQSAGYEGLRAMAAPCRAPLPPPAPHSEPVVREVDRRDLRDFRSEILHWAHRAGFEERARDFVVAVNEIVVNSIRHAGGPPQVWTWRDRSGIVCEVRDRGHIADPLAGRIRPRHDSASGRGLWLANQLCDLVQLRADDHGTTIRLHLRRD
jgi:anti-sigma regulatory factor (Ser/Thr protein kinase)